MFLIKTRCCQIIGLLLQEKFIQIPLKIAQSGHAGSDGLMITAFGFGIIEALHIHVEVVSQNKSFHLVWLNVEKKVATILQKLPKNSHRYFTLKIDVIQNSPVCYQIFGLLL